MSVTLSVKVRKEVAEEVEKMVRYGLARSRSHALKMLIERGLREVREELEYWDRVYKAAEELEKRGYVLRHGGLSKLLEEDRAR